MMRAKKKDISEIFGYAPDDVSVSALKCWRASVCTFTKKTCTKTNHDSTVIYGVCSVSKGVQKGSDVIVCPKRLYCDDFRILQDAADVSWPERSVDLVVGGSLDELRQKASAIQNPVIAFGQHSGNEVAVQQSSGNLSMDWVIQRYSRASEELLPEDFIGIEVQSIDITGNYRDTWSAYNGVKKGESIGVIPESGHGLNWANVHKRLVPQIIRKGQIYRKTDRCVGFFFILPDIVFQKFEDLLGKMETQNKPQKDHLSILTYELGDPPSYGEIRPLNSVRQVHYKLDDIIRAFTSSEGSNSAKELNEKLLNII